jgi:hypothetical protein
MTVSIRRRLAVLSVLPVLGFVFVPARGADVSIPAAAPVPAVKDAAMASGFLRFVDGGVAGGRLETADVTYRNADGVTVRLVSAVHIGEKAYYQGLADSFRADDAVLYELVKPKDAAVPVPGAPPRSGSGVSEIQRMLKDTLNLDFQLDSIDYGQANFVHADLDAETFKKLQEERGETFEMLLLKQVMNAFKQPGHAAAQAGAQAKGIGIDDPEKMLREVIRVVTRPDMERQVKLLVARHMMDVEMNAAGLGDPKNSVIVTERNKAAMNVLADAIAKGKKKISVFYGAAHMPDFSERLASMGFKPVATEWRLAWDVTIRQDEPSAVEDVIVEALKALTEE